MISYFDPTTTSKEIRIAIADRIRTERKNLGLSQEEFAKQIGYSKPTVGSWESKDGFNRIPTFEQIIELCGAFHCEPDYLLCIIDTKSRTAADIQKETGLSETAINSLRIAARNSYYDLSVKPSVDDVNRVSFSQDKIALIDSFIVDCDPIVTSFSNLCSEQFGRINRMYNRDVSDPREMTIQTVFNEVYNSNESEYQKRMTFIDRVSADPQITSSKDYLYQIYDELLNEKLHTQTNYHKYNINLTFEEIITSAVNDNTQWYMDDLYTELIESEDADE